MGEIIYLDHAATTPVDPDVLDAMLPYYREQFGSASTLYSLGRNAKEAVEEARNHVAELIGAQPEEYMRDIDIVRYDRAGNETRRWTLHGAWVKALEYDELEGGSSDNTIEKITICYNYWD